MSKNFSRTRATLACRVCPPLSCNHRLAASTLSKKLQQGKDNAKSAKLEGGGGDLHGMYVTGQPLDNGNARFAQVALFLQVVMIVLYGFVVDYDSATTSKASDSSAGMKFYYPVYQDVHVMILIGFGFLMTFLARYGFGAVGFNFMISAFAIQWAILTNGFWHNVLNNHWSSIQLEITSLITADFAAGAVLITFGALLGKVSPLQLLVVAFIECIFFGANETVGAGKLDAVDMGGSIFVHTFGAYFGLAASLVMCTKEAQDHRKNGSNKNSDMFAMIGTLFLWMFWPSFNGALADGSQQHRVVINTVLALCASAMSAFLFSAMLRKDHKFDMVDIQNATLAGGVAVGSSSDLLIQPWGAMTIGLVAGMVSVAGYVYLSPLLEEKIGLTDTCGVHNLHGMPGIIGALGGAISAAAAKDSVYGSDISSVFPARGPTEAQAIAQGLCGANSTCSSIVLGDGLTAGDQAGRQISALLITLVLALAGGAFAGFVAKQPFFKPPTELFEDEVYWEVAEIDEEEEEAKSHELHHHTNHHH